jgi:hypothetical protein
MCDELLSSHLLSVYICLFSASCRSVHPLVPPVAVVCSSPLAQNEEASEVDENSTHSDDVPLDLLARARYTPLGLGIPPQVQSSALKVRMLYELLPGEDEALRLRDCAFRFAFFLCARLWLLHIKAKLTHPRLRPIQPDHYMKRIHELVYGGSRRGTNPGSSKNDEEAIRLAVLYTVLALGALFTPGLPPRSARAEQLFQLGRTALMSSQVINSPTVEGIQALYLQSVYLCMLETATVSTGNMCWSLSG